MTSLHPHQIKINRAHALSDIGRYPSTASALFTHMPDEAIEQLTGTQMAMILDAFFDVARASKAIANKEVIENGFVWDGQQAITLNTSN